MVEMFDLTIHTRREDFHGAEAENGEFYRCTVYLCGFKGESVSRHRNQAIAFAIEEIAKQLKEHPDD